MELEWVTEYEMMFFNLGQACAALENPAFVDMVIRALDAPGGDHSRARLLELHITLGLILADRPVTSH